MCVCVCVCVCLCVCVSVCLCVCVCVFTHAILLLYIALRDLAAKTYLSFCIMNKNCIGREVGVRRVN